EAAAPRDRMPHVTSERFDDGVRGREAEPVIERLEVVHVEIAERERLSLAPASVEFALDRRAAGKSGGRVQVSPLLAQAQERIHPRQQLPRVERLADEVVG